MASDSPLNLQELIDLVEGRFTNGDPIAYLSEAVIVSDEMNALSDDLVGYFVRLAREAGSSWAEIGTALGVSKQAAQKRFVPGHSRGWSRRGLFMRFSAESRAVVVSAMRKAAARGDHHVDTDHLVLALVEDKGSAAGRALLALGVTPQTAEQAAGAPSRTEATTGHIPFSADAKKALELSLREAIAAHARHIGTEHILLAVLRDSDSTGARILAGLEVTRSAVEGLLGEHAA